jgi:hypothetical protein
MNPKVEAGYRDGWIYFIQIGSSGAIKIGWAKDPAKRIKTLQTSQPKELKILGVIPGTVSDERALHRRFATARISGEWFDRDAVGPEVTNMILDQGFMAVKRPVSRNSPGRKAKTEYFALIPDA